MNLGIPFPTTVVGSFPHTDGRALCQQLAAGLDIPAWPQLPRQNFRESMYVQFSRPLPGVVLDETRQKITFNTTGDLSDVLERFYEHYLADDVDAFALTPEYATGFYEMLDQLGQTAGEWAKGQVTGRSLLLATEVDVLNLDAYGYLDNLALYPAELRAFLDRGGHVAWGIVPNNEEIFQVTPEGLADRLRQGFSLIQTEAQARGVKITAGELAGRSLLTPSCGLGATTAKVSGQVLQLLMATSANLRL